ncbi:hypothetical protein Pcinc_035505 [Petrolisthes cinctipes]|uniref:EF-hand domain-containing protein n=1 Tax=Petrolisthes cinctipes TaxID=88211 RepID=A0AAE1BWM3_PETCI|nr:hypothetical protein Pcinc_035505 [Petrolisthes cinctipes]
MFTAGGFHLVHVKGHPAHRVDAPILAVSPHSSFFDVLLIVVMGAPSIVAKGEVTKIPFFASTGSQSEDSLVYGPYGSNDDEVLWMPMDQNQGAQGYPGPKLPSLLLALIAVSLMPSQFIGPGVPCLVNRIENLQLPFFGKYIDYTQPVYVWREDPNSRQNTIQEIKNRATSKEDWPQIMIFPEGTCTNRSCLITFKPGAFYPGVPVQPVIIRYNNRIDSFTWTWDGPGALKMLWVTLCQFHNFCELEYLPVYTPSEEEKQDAKLFASNVRQVMADALGVPVADYTYDDCRLMHKAKLKNLPYQTGLIEFQKLRQRLGLNLKNVEEELLDQYADIAISDGQITLPDFARYLGIPESEPALVDLFKLYDKDNSNTIDFREYLVGYCQYAKPANNEDTLRCAFKLFDRGGKGRILLRDLIKALRASLDMTQEETERIFKQTDQDNKGYITYEDFEAHAKRKPEYAKIFLTYQESIKNGTRPRTAHLPPPGKKKAD